jgi:hypothetical protein
MCSWIKKVLNEIKSPHSKTKQHATLHVKKWIVERNPALLGSVDYTHGDYSIFKDVLVLTETTEAIRVIIKRQEFWLHKSHVRID